MENRLAVALRAARNDRSFVDLINTNFHACGFFPPADELSRAINAHFAGSSRAYAPDPAGSPALRTAIASFYGRSGVAVDPGACIVTASASESYAHLFNGICGRGATVLLPRPGYPLFEEVARRCSLTPRFYDLRPQNAYAIDPDQIRTMLPHPRRGIKNAVVVISPDNPTGAIARESALRSIGETCAANGAVLIVDEVFSEYRFTGTPLPRAVSLPSLSFTINGASKLLASPDLKVSWVVASGPGSTEAIAALEIENDLYLSASPIGQAAVAALLDRAEEIVRPFVERVAERRSVMLDVLSTIASALPGSVEWVDPEGGIHLPIELRLRGGSPDDEEIAIGLLESASVSFHPGYLYGIDDRTVLVASYLSPPEVIRAGMERLGDCLTRLRTR